MIPVLKNVKFHFSVNHPLSIPERLLNRSSTKKHVNFYVIRLSSFVYIIFNTAGHVNVSGVPSFEAIASALEEFNTHFHCQVKRSAVRIDNTTASGQFSTDFNFPKLLKHCSAKSHPGYKISVRTDFFPSIILRPSHASKNFLEKTATCIIFSNSKYIIVGSKSQDTIQETYLKANTFVSNALSF